jgi:hypothetical protein
VTDETLRRRYARLLWAYPGWYRRERGLEILTTLLDAAGDEQRRPTRADAFNLVLRGVRCRFRPPRAAAGWCLVIANAVLATLYGMALALQSTSYPGPPAEALAVSVARTATGQAPHDIPGPVRSGGYPESWDGRDDVVSHNGPADLGGPQVAVYYNPPAEQAPTRLTQAGQRLAAAGWQVEPVSPVILGLYTFTARKDALVVEATEHTTDEPSFVPYDPAHPDPDGGVPTLEFVVTKTFPASVFMVVLPAGLVAFLAGWLVTTWALHRFRQHRRIPRLVIRLAGTLGVVGVTALYCGYLLLGVLEAVNGEPARHLLIAPIDVLGLLPWAVPGVLVAGGYLIALAVAALPERGQAGRTAPATA